MIDILVQSRCNRRVAERSLWARLEPRHVFVSPRYRKSLLKGFLFFLYAIGGTLAMGLGLGLIVMWAMVSRPPPSGPATPTYIGTAAKVAPYIEPDVQGVATSENFRGDRIRAVSGRIHNRSEQTLQSIGLRLAFHD